MGDQQQPTCMDVKMEAPAEPVLAAVPHLNLNNTQHVHID